jgi:hypothetical protein
MNSRTLIICLKTKEYPGLIKPWTSLIKPWTKQYNIHTYTQRNHIAVINLYLPFTNKKNYLNGNIQNDTTTVPIIGD